MKSKFLWPVWILKDVSMISNVWALKMRFFFHLFCQKNPVIVMWFIFVCDGDSQVCFRFSGVTTAKPLDCKAKGPKNCLAQKHFIFLYPDYPQPHSSQPDTVKFAFLLPLNEMNFSSFVCAVSVPPVSQEKDFSSTDEVL